MPPNLQNSNPPQTPPTDGHLTGQAPIEAGTLLWLALLVLLWGTNAVVVKIAVRDIPPLWAAFLRFLPALPFIFIFIRLNGGGVRLKRKEILLVALAGLLDTAQIFTFYYGSQFTTGGRVTLFIFSYPLVVTLLAPFFLKEEKLEKKNLIGCLIAFVGLLIALRGSLASNYASTFKGDIIEIMSCVLVSIKILYVKRLAISVDKWKILFWSYVFMIVVFFTGAILLESFTLSAVRPDAWAALSYQILAVSVFCFLSWQYIIVRHNSSSVSVFFFATPLFGMLMGVILLNEVFDPTLVTACILVGFGIYTVNRS